MQFMQIVEMRQIMQTVQLIKFCKLVKYWSQMDVALWCNWIGRMGLGWISGWGEVQSTLLCYINIDINCNLHRKHNFWSHWSILSFEFHSYISMTSYSYFRYSKSKLTVSVNQSWHFKVIPMEAAGWWWQAPRTKLFPP